MDLKTLETRIIEFGGQKRQYHVVDRNLGFPAPKFFISYGQGIPFISDEVPEPYRNPMVFHELMEFGVLKGQSNACLNALLTELESVPVAIKYAYIRFRTEVFEHLICYLEDHESSSPFIPEARKSLGHLRGLL